MGKKKIVKPKLKEGETITGELIDVDDKEFTMETADAIVTVTVGGLQSALEDYEGDKIKVTRNGIDYEIEEVE